MNYEELNDWKYNARLGLEQEVERLKEKEGQMRDYMRALDVTEELLSEIGDLKDMLARMRQENELLSNELEERSAEVDALKAELERKQAEIDNLQLKQQLTEAEAKPPEIHNHFESGSSAQVFNDKVTGKFSKFKKWKKRDNKDWRKKKEVKKAS